MNMKRTLIQSCISLLFIMLLFSTAGATVYTFNSFDKSGNSNDMNDLDHYYYYSWAINWKLPTDEEITGAILTFKKIWDWTKETDRLAIHLLDAPPLLYTEIRTATNVDAGGGTTYSTTLSSKLDNQGGGDNFTGKGVLITPIWNDPNGGSATKAIDLVYDLAHLGTQFNSTTGAIIPGEKSILADLNNYIINDGKFGFGIDPDCHYYNDGITLQITTAKVPEPSTMLLIISGLIGVAGMRLFRRD